MSTRRITRVALGIALFVAFSLILQVPVYQNYYISLGYVVMAIYMYSFGPIDGSLVGAVGVVLYCIITGGMRGMPGWALGNIVIGICCGFAFQFTEKRWRDLNNPASMYVCAGINVAAIILSTCFGIGFVKSMTEHLLYAQPLAVRMITNSAATIADVITLIFSLPVAVLVHNVLVQRYPTILNAK